MDGRGMEIWKVYVRLTTRWRGCVWVPVGEDGTLTCADFLTASSMSAHCLCVHCVKQMCSVHYVYI